MTKQARKNKQNNSVQTEKAPTTKSSIFGIDLADFNINSEWIDKINTSISLKTCYNVLLITTIFLAQLTSINGLTTEMAMQSEIHRSVMRILNSEEITSFITAIVIGSTEKYSTLFKSQDIAERYRVLKSARGARNSRFNNVTPSISMTKDALLKYCVGFRFSILGILSTHPVFYSPAVGNWYGLSNLDVKVEYIKSLTEYKDDFQGAIDFIKSKVQEKNPHLENVSEFNITSLQHSLNLYVESTQSKVKLDLLPEDEGTEEERQRARLINEQIKNNSKQ